MKTLLRFILPALALGASSGCLLHDLELGPPDLEAGLSLVRDPSEVDPEAPAAAAQAPPFRVGEGMIAALSIKNRGENQVSVPMPSLHTVSFFKLGANADRSIDVQFLDLQHEAPEFISIDPGDTFSRLFILPHATAEAGDFRFVARYRTELEEGLEGFVPVHSNDVALTVSPPRMFERAAEGYIARQYAEGVVREFFSRPVSRIDAQLIQDASYGAFVWHCTAHFETPDDDGRERRSCLVNAYLGHVAQLVDEHVAP